MAETGGGGEPVRALGRRSGPWERSLSRIGASPVVLFSGGLDSGLVAWELRGRPVTRLHTIGLKPSPDVRSATASASLLGIPHHVHLLSEGEVAAMAARLEPDLGGVSRTERSVQVAFALAVATAPPGVLVCGQGADELFGGYARYARLELREAAEETQRDLTDLRATVWPRTVRIAARLGREVVAPYLDDEFVRAVSGLRPEVRLGRPGTKACLREFARARGLPSELSDRPKKALQFGTGVDQLLRRAAHPPEPSPASTHKYTPSGPRP